jgi:hypothetical protein
MIPPRVDLPRTRPRLRRGLHGGAAAPDGTLQVGAPDEVLAQDDLGHAYGEDVMVVRSTASDGTIVRSCVPMM